MDGQRNQVEITPVIKTYTAYYWQSRKIEHFISSTEIHELENLNLQINTIDMHDYFDIITNYTKIATET